MEAALGCRQRLVTDGVWLQAASGYGRHLVTGWLRTASGYGRRLVTASGNRQRLVTGGVWLRTASGHMRLLVAGSVLLRTASGYRPRLVTDRVWVRTASGYQRRLGFAWVRHHVIEFSQRHHMIEFSLLHWSGGTRELWTIVPGDLSSSWHARQSYEAIPRRCPCNVPGVPRFASMHARVMVFGEYCAPSGLRTLLPYEARA